MRMSGVFDDILAAYLGGKRRILLEGGTFSTKTWSALQALIMIGQSTKEELLISIVSESLPHLKRGAIRDFFKILDEPQDGNSRWSKSDFIYTFGKARVEFFGADDAGKVRGPRRHILFINEGNNIPWETADGLDSRTLMFTIVDWNPVGEFWAHEKWIGEAKNAYNHSTYLDAKGILSQVTIDTIEEHKDKDPNWWNIYGLGLQGKIEGLVYPRFEQVDELPIGAYFYGVDFGFSSDPTVIVKNVVIGDRLYSEQMLYDNTGLTNDAIAQRFHLIGYSGEPVFVDPNEPKSAEELRQKGINVQETVKGPGSVAFGIQKVNQYYQYWVKRSIDCIKEQRNCRWIKDRVTGMFTDRITHQWSHVMDARRYACSSEVFNHFVMPKAVRYI